MSTSSKDLADVYQEKTDIEHILDAPDTYIGSVDIDRVEGWTINDENNMTENAILFFEQFCHFLQNHRGSTTILEMQKSAQKVIQKQVESGPTFCHLIAAAMKYSNKIQKGSKNKH